MADIGMSPTPILDNCQWETERSKGTHKGRSEPGWVPPRTLRSESDAAAFLWARACSVKAGHLRDPTFGLKWTALAV